jgi:hypothetical protein
MSKAKKEIPIPPPRGQVVVILKENSGPVLSKAEKSIATSSAPETALQVTLEKLGVNLIPVFGDNEAHVERIASSASEKNLVPSETLSRMQTVYTVENQENIDVDKIAAELNKLEIVDGAYVKPIGEPPVYLDDSEKSPGFLKATGGDVPITFSLVANQTYLNPAPGGIDANFAHTIAGGRGDGVNVIDIEGGWNFGHEDLLQNNGGLLHGFNNTADPGWLEHGTAVAGEIGGDSNTKGITGISPNAIFRGASVFTNSLLAYNSALAIRVAADALRAGDVMLIEQHRSGPGASGAGQDGYIAIQWWPDDFLALQYATSKGIIVVEAAGNGNRNLDNAIYDTPSLGFPSWWKNPFKRNNGGLDCGSILVGAGAPPPGTNGMNFGVDRSRLSFSNYGSCIDVQGWGRGVTTTGYGDVHGTNAANKNEWYTNGFSGTSSASPIVTGAVASLQGVQRAAGRALLTPSRMRQLFRTTGSPQQADPSAPVTQRIGNRPDLKALINAVKTAPNWCGVQFTGNVAALQTQSWFTHSWPDNWNVVWTVVPTAPIIDGNAQMEFSVQVDRQSFGLLKYFIIIKNLTNTPVTIEARYCVLAS